MNRSLLTGLSITAGSTYPIVRTATYGCAVCAWHKGATQEVVEAISPSSLTKIERHLPQKEAAPLFLHKGTACQEMNPKDWVCIEGWFF